MLVRHHCSADLAPDEGPRRKAGADIAHSEGVKPSKRVGAVDGAASPVRRTDRGCQASVTPDTGCG